MPDYMILVLESESARRQMAPTDTKGLVEGHAAYVERLKALGAYRDGERLRPSAEGKRVSGRAVEAGPFGDEAALAGYYVVQAPDLDAALELARACPTAPGGTQEVRPVMSGTVSAGKTQRAGKTFAFAVLGKAPDERAWVDLMDRIDDAARGFSDERFAGGVRLEAPSRGRRVATHAGKNMVVDGPFLESKEVIGGVFFMRMGDLDEAVRWAAGTTFVEHGTLEVRELWRT